ncbi:MAG: cupin-like domain-containing protein [Nostoc sp. ChiSLP01]|nr:cupin-like domain-containing protein [Nostoc sp. CmiSLP01]MDZ8282663.1 cupin-like domain-containing protein [Nostoc sp. ChiSLP01]
MKAQASKSILRIKNPSKKEFSEIAKKFQPFIIEDVVQHWDAYKNWSDDYLIEKCGDNLVPVRFFQKNFWNDYKNFAYERSYEPHKEIKLKEYINNGHNVECYLNEAVFEERFPQIVGDVNYPEYFNGKAFVRLWYGLSSKTFSSSSSLHFDAEHNIFAQIRGRKRILLYPPIDYLSFYPPLEDPSGALYGSKVNPDSLDLELFPKFPWQERIEIVLQPGEILYLPPFWWHHITAVDDNISLSFWHYVKLQDFWWQKKMLSVFFHTAPHYLYHSISAGNFSGLGFFNMS